MPLIQLNTYIKAPGERCWALSLSPEVHVSSMAHTRERMVAGPSGKIFVLNDEVTWEAFHFLVKQRLTVRITALRFPDYFCDEMIRGIFKTMRHEHYFDAQGDTTHMRDAFYYQAPLGFLGRIADVLFLRRYMTRLLERRNAAIKHLAEAAVMSE